MTDILPCAGKPATPGFKLDPIGEPQQTDRDVASFADLLASLLPQQPGQDEPKTRNFEQLERGCETVEDAADEVRATRGDRERIPDDQLTHIPTEAQVNGQHKQIHEQPAALDVDVQSFLGDDGRPDQRIARIARLVAEIFNEFGVLHTRVDMPRSGFGAMEDPSETVSRMDTAKTAAPVPARHVVEAVHLTALQTSQDGAIGSGAERMTTRHPDQPGAGSKPSSRSMAAKSPFLPSDRPTASGAQARPAMLADPAESTKPEQAPAEAEEPHGGQSEQSLRDGHVSDAQVILELAEEGIRIAARAGRLTHEQREKLRQAIAALIARHGFRPAEIRLNGFRPPSRQATEGDV